MRNAQSVKLGLESDAYVYATSGVLFREAKFLLHLH
jgi:hypothetical protein